MKSYYLAYWIILFSLSPAPILHAQVIKAAFPSSRTVKKPEIEELDSYLLEREGYCEKYEIIFDSIGVILESDPDPWEPARIIFQFANGSIQKFNVSYSIFSPYYQRCVAFDADQNGLNDFFVISVKTGASGSGANTPRIAAFLFFEDEVIRLTELSSYNGDVNLFGDWNSDGNYEFACIKILGTHTEPYYSINLFALENGEFVNISGEDPRFPIFIKCKGGWTDGCEESTEIPDHLKDHLLIDRPNLWERE